MATTAPRAEPAPSLWQTLADQIAFGNYVPVPAPPEQIEERAFTRSDGETYHVLKHREFKTYLSLPEDAFYLWQMMDGERPIRSIAVDFALKRRRIVTGLLRGLVEDLRTRGMLEDPPRRIFSTLDARRISRSPSSWIPRLLGRLIATDLGTYRQGDAILGALYRWGGWLFFTRPAVAAMLLIMVAGFGAWAGSLSAGRHALLTVGGSYVLGLVSFFLLDGLMTTLHEMGHGLSVKHHGREVSSVGVSLYYGAPCAFVNTTDMWLADRWPRIQVSIAGPFVTLVLAGVMGIVAYTTPEGSIVGDLALKAATLWFIDGLFNAIPLLELDGYFVLVDWLEMPMLRARSFEFVKRDLWRKLRQREGWRREERILGWFGVLAMAFSAAMLGLTFWGLQTRAGNAMVELWNQPAWWGKPLLLLFLFILGGPFALGVIAMARGGLGWLFGRIASALRERSLLHRADPLLASMPYLSHLAPHERAALAQHTVLRKAGAGATVVRQGDPPDGFYVIRHGQAEVERREPDGRLRTLAVLGPGEFFGELAYLNHARRDATVRARTPLELYYLDGGHFSRWLAGDLGSRAEVERRMLDQATVERLPLFHGLTPSQRHALSSHMGVKRFVAGETVFRQGEPGDAMYVISQGSFEVLAEPSAADTASQPAIIARLGVGDLFGEIALLTSEPRNATVRAATEGVCYTLDQEGFAQLLDVSPASQTSLRNLATERRGSLHPGPVAPMEAVS
ncbi:MAG: cyclic nucleotide-binding domain-containing protein [Chloroflexota bacterium]